MVPRISYNGRYYRFPASWDDQTLLEYLLIRYSGDYVDGQVMCVGGPLNATWVNEPTYGYKLKIYSLNGNSINFYAYGDTDVIGEMLEGLF